MGEFWCTMKISQEEFIHLCIIMKGRGTKHWKNIYKYNENWKIKYYYEQGQSQNIGLVRA